MFQGCPKEYACYIISFPNCSLEGRNSKICFNVYFSLFSDTGISLAILILKLAEETLGEWLEWDARMEKTG